MLSSRRLPALLAVCALVATFLATAWLSDDCYFTLRTVRNVIAGEGPRWNVFERVQAYTHPGWMLVLVGAIGATGEHYLTTIGVSIVVSLAACATLVAASRPGMRFPVVALLLVSRAFVDYSTGGLANPLIHLIAALFLLRLARGRPEDLGGPALLAALSALTRLDTILVFVPLLAARTWHSLRARGGWRTAGTLALAFTPLAAWELFSFVYYGFFFPNTAYAKLGTGLTPGDLLPRGLAYLADSLRNDPATLLAIVVAIAVGLRRRGEDAFLALGTLLYVAYVLRIGGGFMSGRLLALPFFVAAGVLGRTEIAPRRVLAWAPALAFLVGLWLHRFELLFVPPRGAGVMQDGISDERVVYWSRTGLLRPGSRLQPEPFAPPPRKQRPGDVLWGWSGMQAFHAAPDTIVVERYGLGDPLLARLPARFDPSWRVGHYERFVPIGYGERLVGGDVAALRDQELARYDALLRRVTSGPLWSLGRLRIALELQLGRHDELIDRTFYRYPLLRECDLVEEEPGQWGEGGCLGPLAQEGALLTSDEPLAVESIEILADGALASVELLIGDEIVERIELTGPPPPDGVYVVECDEGSITGVWVQPELPDQGEPAVRLLDVVLIECDEPSEEPLPGS